MFSVTAIFGHKFIPILLINMGTKNSLLACSISPNFPLNAIIKIALSDLGRGRNKLLQAVRYVPGARLLFVTRQLVILAKYGGDRNITFAIGIEQDDPDMPYSFGQFEAQLTAICSLMTNLESADAIRHVASYLDTTADLFICTG